MSSFRARKGVVKAVVLVSVLLLVPALSLFAVQGQNQDVNPLFYQFLFPYVDSPAVQPVLAKADAVWNDTVIGSGVSWFNESVVIILNGNLTIESGGSLVFSNVTLLVNCSFDGQRRIEVQSGGSFFVNDTDGNPSTSGDASNITAYNSSNSYLFWVKSDATFQMNNSELHYCGYSKYPFTDVDDFGLWINANHTIIENNSFSNNHVGLVLYYAHYNTIRNNNITDSEWNGVQLEYSSNNNFTGNTVTNSQTVGSGFYLGDSPDNILIGNTATSNSYEGFWLAGSSTSNNTLIGNIAIDNWYGFRLSNNANNNNLTGNVAINNSQYWPFEDYGFWLDSSSDNNLTNNTAMNSEYGFFVNASSNNNDLFSNDAVNCSVRGYYLGGDCFGNDLSGSTVFNFLRIRVVDLNDVGVPGVDVMVASGGVVVYASPGYGGGNDSTDSDGCTGWITVAYQRYSGVTSSDLVVEVWVLGYGHRLVNMTSSHTETFSKSESLLPLVVLFYAIQALGIQSAQNMLIVSELSVVVLLAVSALALYLLRRKA